MPQIIVQDTLISYTDTGKGPVLVCIHGWMHDKDSFKQLTAELKDKFRIISLDLPNFGDSQINETIYSIDSYGSFIAYFIEKLAVKQYVLIGHSMGGQIIIKVAAEGVLKPQKLILIASAGVRDNRKVYKFFLKFMSKIFRHITPKNLKNRFYSVIGSDYKADLSEIHKKVINQTLSADIQTDARAIEIPTLLIYGSKDTSTPVWMGEKLASLILGSKIEIIDGENHWVHQTSAGETARYIEDFLGVPKN